ncbi:MAG: glycolate oxidase subunit GlcF [Proteobacteria bacterium]|jgi:glycolate oxidase iron-sulfur subunit|nr:glycolate oxidase subunit GlcF [Pseudomonadota bacterium]MDA1299564.1 glycolate oxidase subunit GlcF [Pseudomonadota bacterium]
MQTDIHPQLAGRRDVGEAEDILRSCVHCGFCTATCPTYQLLGDELDGPRGRIYLIKNLLEVAPEDRDVARASLPHLDRCLTCRSCETTCPSGVRYGRLLDIARGLISERAKPVLARRMASLLIRLVVPRPMIFGAMLKLGQLLRPILPGALARKVPMVPRVDGPGFSKTGSSPVSGSISAPKHDRRVILLNGCVQRAATPDVNRAIEVLLDRMGIAVEYLSEEGCCGALDYHLAAQDTGRARMRRLIDLLHPRLADVEAIVSSASGCGVTIKEYPDILTGEPCEARAREVAGKVVDVSELLETAEWNCRSARVAVHSPCSLTHGQGRAGSIEQILVRAGMEVVPVRDGHLCCGSAGTYSILQPQLAGQLLSNKVAALGANDPEIIVTGNVGCHLHLQGGTDIPVMHWAELLASRLTDPPQADRASA